MLCAQKTLKDGSEISLPKRREGDWRRRGHRLESRSFVVASSNEPKRSPARMTSSVSPTSDVHFLDSTETLSKPETHITHVKLIGSDVKALVQLSSSSKSLSDASREGDAVLCAVKGLNSKKQRIVVIYVRKQNERGSVTHRRSSIFEFVLLDDADRTSVVDDFDRFLTFALSSRPCDALQRPGTYFVSMTFPDMRSVMSAKIGWKAPEWISNNGKHHGLEFRADLLTDAVIAEDDPDGMGRADSVMTQLALVRRCGLGLPIIYTVRSKGQGGSFPDDEEAAWKLMLLGLRFGVEYIDVEACWSRLRRERFISIARAISPLTRIIGSFHAVQRSLCDISDNDVRGIFTECAHGGVDVVKVVARARDVQCSIRINQFARKLVRESSVDSPPPVVAICTTDAGRLSRALNVSLGPTPVAHPAFPGRAAPGQLSVKEIEDLRRALGIPTALADDCSERKRRRV